MINELTIVWLLTQTGFVQPIQSTSTWNQFAANQNKVKKVCQLPSLFYHEIAGCQDTGVHSIPSLGTVPQVWSLTGIFYMNALQGNMQISKVL